MKPLKRSLLFISIILAVSCQKEYNSEVCQDLSMRSFKGSPHAANEFQNNCQDIEIPISHQMCQRALNDLILSGSLNQVINKYKEPIKDCFSQNDLNTFNKD